MQRQQQHQEHRTVVKPKNTIKSSLLEQQKASSRLKGYQNSKYYGVNNDNVNDVNGDHDHVMSDLILRREHDDHSSGKFALHNLYYEADKKVKAVIKQFNGHPLVQTHVQPNQQVKKRYSDIHGMHIRCVNLLSWINHSLNTYARDHKITSNNYVNELSNKKQKIKVDAELLNHTRHAIDQLLGSSSSKTTKRYMCYELLKNLNCSCVQNLEVYNRDGSFGIALTKSKVYIPCSIQCIIYTRDCLLMCVDKLVNEVKNLQKVAINEIEFGLRRTVDEWNVFIELFYKS